MDQDKRCRSGAFDADQRTKLDSLFILISLLSNSKILPGGRGFFAPKCSKAGHGAQGFD
jgi:hypothetical protein